MESLYIIHLLKSNTMQIPVCESKNSEKVIRFVSLTVDALTEYCSKKYAKKIIQAYMNNQFWGAHFTKSGRLKVTFY